jgi:V/A-type H+-transporting ATPase subunit K
MADITTGLIAIGAGVAIGFAGLGSGLGQGIASSAAAGATAEDESLLAKMLVFAALPETQVIYGFVIAIILLFVFGG